MLDFLFSSQCTRPRPTERAGLRVRVTPHMMRHTFATRFLEQSPGDICTLAAILGHANISTTSRYAHPRAQRMQEMVEYL